MKRKPGFTLVEILVALTVFSIGAVTIFVVFPASSMAVRQAREYTDVAFLLESQLEVVRATPFSELASKTITENLPAYVEKIERIVTDDTTLSELKMVEVQIAYTSKGRTRAKSVTTYVANV